MVVGFGNGLAHVELAPRIDQVPIMVLSLRTKVILRQPQVTDIISWNIPLVCAKTLPWNKNLTTIPPLRDLSIASLSITLCRDAAAGYAN
jgi:hypothetical protein